MSRERILLMGAPSAGKSYQLIKVIEFLKEYSIPVYVIDLEDKLEAQFNALGGIPENASLYTTVVWDEEPDNKTDYPGGLKQVVNSIEQLAKPGDWIMVDRVDLAWPKVINWFTEEKYKESFAERMMDKSKAMTKSSQFIPVFDQGSWQVINKQYEDLILKVLYKTRCNVLLTAGIKAIGETQIDVYGSLGVMPRGQKELGHQPNSTFLLFMSKSGRTLSWHITTGKDLPGREWFEKDDLYDFSLQYLFQYYKPEYPMKNIRNK